jgi:hypothetical protein
MRLISVAVANKSTAVHEILNSFWIPTVTFTGSLRL